MKPEMPKGLLLGLSILFLVCFLELFVSPRLSNAQGNKHKSRNFVDASSNNFPPMNALDKDGNLTGFGRDLADAVVKAIDGKVTHIHSGHWVQVLEWLDSGKADFIHDTGYTKDRDEFLDYSAPIIEMPEVIFVRPDQYDITGLNSLKDKTVACVNKHITHLYLQTFPEINCHVVKTPVEGLYELVAGKVDAFVYPKQIVLYFSQNLKLRDKIKITGKSLRTLTWSMVVKEGDKELLRLLNEGIAKVRESGEYERIYNKWWGRKILAGYSKGELQVITAVTTGVTLLLVLAISLIFFNRKIQRGKRDLEREIIVRKQVEGGLRESEEKYRSLFNDALDMIHIVDENGRIIDANPIELETMEYTSEEYFGKPLFEIIHPDYLMITKETFASVLKGEGLKAYETALLTKSGQKIDVEVSAVPQIESGEIVGTRAIIRDITERKQADKELAKHREHLEELVKERTAELTKANQHLRRQIEERKRAEEALRESENSFAEAQRVAHMGNWNLDLVKNELRWSAEIYRIFGLKPQEFGATYEAFLNTVHPDDREFVDTSYTKSIESNTPYDIVHRIVRPDGEVRYVHEKAGDIKDETGKTIRSIGTVQDITKRKEAEDALKKSTAELRKMVNAMSGREVRMAELKETIRKLRAQLEEEGLAPVANDPLREGSEE